jgi:glucose/arabinose dehydrogenase
MRRVGSILVAVGVFAAACGRGGGTQVVLTPPTSPVQTTTPPVPSVTMTSPSPTAEPGGDLSNVHIELSRIATLDQPLAMAVRTGDDALYVAEKGGVIVAIRNGNVDPTPVLDISGDVSGGGEQGLLGLAFSPDGAFLYVNYTDTGGDTQVVEYAFGDSGAVKGSRRPVLSIHQPFSNHNGGNLVFGPDGFLYIGMGDGGSQGDPNRNGQNLGVLLAKMLRIDPRPFQGAPYSVPSDNPFVGRAGARPEIWAYGVRNPWRFSFDRETGDLWIGDVGGSDREEVDFQPAGQGGQNYGWNLMEGTLPRSDNLPAGMTLPIYDYDHSDGRCVVTGGYVYRGSAIPALYGAYLFVDFCQGQLMGLREVGGVRKQVLALGPSVDEVASFGQDQNGELYMLSLAGDVFRIVQG